MLYKWNWKYTMELVLLNSCKSKEKFEKTRHVKNNDKSKRYFLRGQRNVTYHDRILSNKNFFIISRHK